jgi:predicted negative regulator of RcsB-dependent stress response
VAAAAPDALEVAGTEVEQSAMAAARLQLRRMVRERADAATPALRLGRD